MNHHVRSMQLFHRVARGWLCGLTALLVTISGCTSLTGAEPGGWNWKNPFARSKPKVIQSKYGEPARIVAIWTPDVLTMPGKQPTRGFGGRLYFYNNRNETIPVDGQLVVYGFDDTDPDQGKTVPEKRFAFTPEQFTQHFSATDLGASYSIWVPWDTAESAHKVVSLVPVFTSTSGHRIVGQQSLNALAGRKPPKQKKKKSSEESESWNDLGVQSASFQQHALAPQHPQSSHAAGVQPWGPVTQEELLRARRQTTTIQMPSTMASRSIHGTNAAPPSGENRTVARNLEGQQPLPLQGFHSMPGQPHPGQTFSGQPHPGQPQPAGHPIPQHPIPPPAAPHHGAHPQSGMTYPSFQAAPPHHHGAATQTGVMPASHHAGISPQFNAPPPHSSGPMPRDGVGGGRYPGHPVPTGFNIRAGDQAGQPARFAHRELQAPASVTGQPVRDHAGWQQFPGEQRRSHPSGPQSGHSP
jgi:hypothetical protein